MRGSKGEFWVMGGSAYEESIGPGVGTLFNVVVFMGADYIGRCRMKIGVS